MAISNGRIQFMNWFNRLCRSSNNEVDGEFIHQYLSQFHVPWMYRSRVGKKYQLISMSVDSLPPTDYQAVDRADAERYSKMPAETSPPIVIDLNGISVDGQHRLAAARIRGDKTIMVYKQVE